MTAKILPKDFYLHNDVIHLSRELIGKVLCTNFNGQLTSGIIVETEAYRAPDDRASHAYGGKRTPRNLVMYSEGGVCYVYTCYGIHSLFNVITNEFNIPHGILIRALEPLDGVDVMLKRRKLIKLQKILTAGPGNLTKALGITNKYSGHSLQQKPIWIEDRGSILKEPVIVSSTRIGIDYAGEDAHLLWRFYIQGSPWVSKR